MIPELYVDDLHQSIGFYAMLGFRMLYARPAERFAMIEREGTWLMLEEPVGRVFSRLEDKTKRGVGINLQIAVRDLEQLICNLPAQTTIVLPSETKTYWRLEDEITIRQIVIADPDGYLLRFSQTLGVRPVRPQATP